MRVCDSCGLLRDLEEIEVHYWNGSVWGLELCRTCGEVYDKELQSLFDRFITARKEAQKKGLRRSLCSCR